MTGQDGLVAILDRYAGAVGLKRVDPYPTLGGAGTLPPGAALWAASYAHVLLWPVAVSSVTNLLGAAEEGQNWFDLWLSAEELRLPGLVDGYLVLMLPTPPDADLRTHLARIESDPRVCRKHVIWPGAGGSSLNGWSRVGRITLLGLPPSPGHGAPAEPPSLTKDQQSVVDGVLMGSVSAAVRRDAQGDSE